MTGARKRTRALALTIALVGALAACGGGSSVASSGSSGSSSAAAAAPSTGPLTIASFAFSPTPYVVKAGATVTVANHDDQPHTATADTPGVFDSGSVAAMGQATFVVQQPGTYQLHCSFHPFMHGTLVVV